MTQLLSTGGRRRKRGNRTGGLAVHSGVATALLCAAYFASAGHEVAMRAVQSAGSWARAVQVTPRANAGSGTKEFSLLDSAACVRSRSWVIVGNYQDAVGHSQAMAITTSAP